jgi:hypothetical protein
MAALDSFRTINGTYGSVYEDGEWLTNFNKMTAQVEIQKSELKLSGDRWIRHKVTGLKGTGTITGLKVTSRMTQLNQDVTLDNRAKTTRTELISKIDDPEAFGAERIRLKNVIFDRLHLAEWEAGVVIPEELAFTFEEWEPLDPIEHVYENRG